MNWEIGRLNSLPKVKGRTAEGEQPDTRERQNELEGCRGDEL